jgi:L-lactate dehydrogenase complex protein LldG
MANSSRDNILAGIKSALTHLPEQMPKRPDMVSPIYTPETANDPAILFAENFTARKGIFFYSESLKEFQAQIAEFLKERKFKNIHVWEKELAEELESTGISFATHDRNFAEVDCGITLCECLITRSGSFIMTSRQLAGRRLAIFPPVHIVVASVGQLVPDIKDGMAFIQKKYGDRLPSMISLITGASRTADIEKTLVLGAHGPKELVLFLIDDVQPS